METEKEILNEEEVEKKIYYFLAFSDDFDLCTSNKLKKQLAKIVAKNITDFWKCDLPSAEREKQKIRDMLEHEYDILLIIERFLLGINRINV